MFKTYEKSVRLWHFDNLLKYENLLQFVSTRMGGYSNPPYDSLNLGFSSGDNPIQVSKNRETLSSTLGIFPDNLVTSRQVHGDNIRIITEGMIKADLSFNRIPKETGDGMVTNLPNVCLTVIIADCAPVMLYDPKNNVVGIAHAGWRGTIKRVSQRVLEAMLKEYDCNPGDIVAGIGPSIGPCCYQVGGEVVAEVKKYLGGGQGLISRETSDGKGYFDLWEANRKQLLEMGIPERNIEVSNLCTHCHHDMFFSYRYQGPLFGRFAAGIMLK